MNKLEKTHRFLYRANQNKKHKIATELILLSAAGYLTAKKLFDLSITSHLQKYVSDDIIFALVILAAIGITYSLVVKALDLIFVTFPASRVINNEAEALTHTCLRINNEITEHIRTIRSNGNSLLVSLEHKHAFQGNVALATESLANHIRATLKDAKKNDVFISVYQIEKFNQTNPNQNTLQYVCHYPYNKDSISNFTIYLEDEKFEKYECVKGLQTAEHTRIVHDCDHYHKSGNRRLRKIKHYMGTKIMYLDTPLGYLNIEFHNRSFFGDEDEMQSYLEENILTFKYLIEYQFLKGLFFCELKNKLTQGVHNEDPKAS